MISAGECYVMKVHAIQFLTGTKNAVKSVHKVSQGTARDEGKTWLIQQKDKLE